MTKSGFKLVHLIGLLTLLGSAAPSFAATYIWDGSSSTAWETLANWTVSGGTPGTLPGASDSVNIPTTTTDPTVNTATSIGALSFTGSASRLTLNNSLDVLGNVTITQSGSTTANEWFINGQTATVGGRLTFLSTVTTSSRIARITITTGTLNVNNLSFVTSISANKVINITGAGTVNLSGALLVPATSSTLTSSATAKFRYNGTAAQTVNFFTAGAYSNLHIDNTFNTGAVLGTAISATNVTGTIAVGSLNSASLLRTNNLAVARATGDSLRIYSGSTLDAGTTSLTWASSTNSVARIEGTFKTANTTGFTVASGAINSTNGPAVTLTSTSTINYSAAAGGQTVTSRTYDGNLTMSNTSNSQTLAGDVTVAGVLTTTAGGTLTFGTTARTLTLSGTAANRLVNGGTILMNGSNAAHVLEIAAVSNSSLGTLTQGTGSTIEYNAASGGQTVNAFTYNHLMLSNASGTQTAGGNLTVNGTLTTTAGGTLDMTPAFTLGGTLAAITNNGTIETAVPTGTSATPIPSGRSWGGTVRYNAVAGLQTVAQGTYNNLTLANTSGKQTAGGNLAVNGTLTTTAGGTLDMTAAFTLGGTLATITNNGTIETASPTTNSPTPIAPGRSWGGTIVYDAVAGLQTVVAGTYNNLTLANASGENVAGGNLVVNGALTTTAGGSLQMGSSATLTGTLATITNNGFIKTSVPTSTSSEPLGSGKTWGGTGTVEYELLTGAQTVVTGTYNNLTLENTSGTNVASEDVTVNAVLTTAAGGTFDMGTGVLTATGVPSHAGILRTENTAAAPISANKTWGGTVIYTGVTGTQTVVAGTYNNLTLSNASGTNSAGGAVIVGGILTLGTGSFAVGSNTLSLNGPAIAGTPASLVTTSSSSLSFGGSAPGLSLPGSVTALNNLTLNNTNGLSLSGSPTLSGTLTLTTGALTVGSNTLTLNGPTIAGTPANLATSASSSLSFGGSASGVLVPSSVAALANLTLNNGNGITLGASLAISGALTQTSGNIAVGANTLTVNGSHTATAVPAVTGAGGYTLGSGASFATANVNGVGGASATIQTTTKTFANTNNNFTFDGSGAQVTSTILPATVNNLTISNPAGVSASQGISVSGTLTLNNGSFAVGSNTLALNGPAIAGAPANLVTTSSSSLSFGGSASGLSLPGSVTVLNNLTLNNTNGLSLSGSPTLSGTLTLTTGSLTVGSNALGLNGPAIAGTPANLVTTSSSSLSFGGSSSGVNLPAGVTALNNLTLNNANGLTLNGSPILSGTLTLTSGKITTGANTLAIAAGGSVSGAGAATYVVGNLRKFIPNAAAPSATFEVGVASAYRPVTIAFAGTTAGSGSLTASTTTSDHPDLATSDLGATRSVNAYWTVTNSGITGFTSYNATLNWVAGDLDGSASTPGFLVRKFNNPTWSSPPGASDQQTATSIRGTGFTTFSDFAVGNVATHTYTWDGGGADDNWMTAANWVGDVAPVAGDSLIFTGTTRLNPVNNFTNGTTFSSIDINATGFTLSGNSVSLTTGLTNATGSSTVSLVVGGAGGVTQNSAGTLTLSGANSYTGPTMVSAGTLKVGAPGDATNAPLGTIAGITTVASGATLDLNGFTLGTAEPVTLNGDGVGGTAGALTNSSGSASTFSGLLTLGSASSIIADNGDLILSAAGTITGSGFGLTLGGSNAASSLASILGTGSGSVLKTGPGTWTLSGVSTYTGGTTVRAGTLEAATSAQALGNGGNVTLGHTSGSDDATLFLTTDGLVIPRPIVLATGTTGQLTLGTLGSNVSAGFSGGVTGTNDLLVNVDAAAGMLTFSSAAVNNTGNVTNGGGGPGAAVFSSGIGGNVTQVIQGSGSSELLVTGALVVDVGDKLLRNDAGTALLTVQGGVTGTGDLDLKNESSTGNAINFLGSTVNHGGAITNSGSGSGSVLINAPVGSNVTGIYSNSATSGLSVTSAVTVNSTETTLEVAPASTAIAFTGGIGGTGNLILNNNGTAPDGISITSGSVNNDGTVVNSGSGTGNILIGSVIGTNVDGVIQNSATSGVTLGGANTFTTGLTVRAGTVRGITSSAAFGAGGITLGHTSGSANASIFAGGNLTFMNPIVLATGTSGTLTVGGESGVSATFGGNLTGVNNLTLSGSGGFLVLTSANNAGTITSNSAGAGTTVVQAVGSNVTQFIQNAATRTFEFGTLAVNGSGTTLTNNGGGLLSGFGNISGTGNLILNNASSVANAINLNGASVNHTGLVTNSGAGTGGSIVSSIIGASVSGVIQNSALSQLTLSGANTFTSGLSIRAGAVRANTTGSALGAGNVNLGHTSGSDNATLRIGTSGLTFSQPIVLGATSGTKLIGNTGTAVSAEFSGGVTGSGNLTIQSNATSGTLTFSSVAVNPAGTVILEGTASGAVSITGGVGSNVTGVTQNSSTAALNIATTALTVNASGTSLTNEAGTALLTVSGGVNGTGNLTLNNNSATIDGITLSTNAVNPAGLILNAGNDIGTVLISAPVGSNVTGIQGNSETSGLTVSGPLTVNGTATTVANNSSGTVLTLSGGVTGTGNLILNNHGPLTDGLVVTGDSLKNSGTVTASGSGGGTASVLITSPVASTVTAISNTSPTNLDLQAILRVNAGGTTVSSSSTGVFTLIGGVAGTGDLILRNNGSSNGVLKFQFGAVNPVGAIHNTGSGTGNAAIEVTIGANVTGITQNAANSLLRLTGTNTSFAGPVTLTSGILTAQSNNSLGNGSVTNALVFNGGMLRTTGIIATSSRPVTLSATALIEANHSVTFAGTVSGAGGLTKSGSSTLTLNGTTSLGGGLTISAGTLTGPASNAFSVAGDWINDGTYTHNGGTVTLNGSSSQAVGGSSATTFNNLTLNNATGATISTSPTVNGTLTFTNGKITTGANKVAIAASGSVTGANSSRFVIGNLERFIPNAASPSATFDIGEGTSYRPVTVAFGGTTTGSGSLTASTSLTEDPNNATSKLDTDEDVAGQWNLTNSGVGGFTSHNSTFTWPASDLDGGASTSDFRIRKFTSGSWSSPTSDNQTATSIRASSVPNFGMFKVGRAPTFTSVSPVSRGQGAANQALTVTGTGFNSGATVSFSGTGITVNSVTFNSSTSLTVNVTVAPSVTLSARDLVITNAEGGEVTGSDAFTVNAAPAFTSIVSASLGQGATSQNLEVVGTGFVDGVVASFSGTGITVHSTTFNSATSLTVNVSVDGGAAATARDLVF
ncbi:MAG: transporter, partial [Fibrobacteria bacterium]|nr:transporter [Fibrobacteria bacterium]